MAGLEQHPEEEEEVEARGGVKLSRVETSFEAGPEQQLDFALALAWGGFNVEVEVEAEAFEVTTDRGARRTTVQRHVPPRRQLQGFKSEETVNDWGPGSARERQGVEELRRRTLNRWRTRRLADHR